MKKLLSIFLLTILLLQGCVSSQNTPSSQTQPSLPPGSEQPAQQSPPDTIKPETPPQSSEPAQPTGEDKKGDSSAYSNDIFQDVTVAKEAADTYTVKGKARVFEATFQYVVEDGHNELTKGTVQSSVAAPEWGDFQFTVKVKKDQPNSTLTLVLFEASAKDGSRRMELPIALPEK
ncbi:sporulation protein [Brevibacillus ruminantium]|uniref:Sporulation protein n=1 Tax=Brevibacillus ruminantium TaxID=2950604 RepID=A0ABY4WF35_9BACL|nr:Gmad2 immunoglobulin-like domain-containing protein [Brevibacillus ruminantium]USG63934.1 sporulation protein [Brevibacillus ruminantium]